MAAKFEDNRESLLVDFEFDHLHLEGRAKLMSEKFRHIALFILESDAVGVQIHVTLLRSKANGS